MERRSGHFEVSHVPHTVYAVIMQSVHLLDQTEFVTSTEAACCIRCMPCLPGSYISAHDLHLGCNVYLSRHCISQVSPTS